MENVTEFKAVPQMKELSRMEMAAVKRNVKTLKGRRNRVEKLKANIAKASLEVENLEKEIALWEAPIVAMTGGFTSEEVVNGITNIPTIDARTETPYGDEADDLVEEATSDEEFAIRAEATDDELHTANTDASMDDSNY